MSANQSPPNKRNRVSATTKQARTAAYMASHPHASIKEAMIKGGEYAPATAHNPGKNFVAASGTLSIVEQFRELATTRLNDELIISKIEEILHATKLNNSLTEPDKIVPDYPTRVKGVELSLKVRGLDAQPSQQTNVQVNFGDLKSKYHK